MSSERHGTDRSNRGLVIGGAVAGIVVVIGLVVFLWPSDDDGGSQAAGTGAAAAANATQEDASVAISGEDLPEFPDTGELLVDPASDPAVGLEAPALSGESFDGSEVVISPDDGKPKIVVFLAHWCHVCQGEVPVLQDWIDSGGVPEGVEVVSVATGQDPAKPNYPPSSWLVSEGWAPEVLLDDTSYSAAASWGLRSYPYFVMVDAEGKVWQRGSGSIPADELTDLADRLAAGEPATGTGDTDATNTPAD